MNAASLTDAIRLAGLIPPDVIEPGKFYRFRGQDKGNSNKAGWCRLFDDGLGGVFGDWSIGLSETWQAKPERPLTPSEVEAHKRQIAESRAKANAERQAAKDTAAKKAREIWAKAVPATSHAYLESKGVTATCARIYRDALLIPIRNAEGGLQSLQFIMPDGTKRFLKDGAIEGGYVAIGGRPTDQLAICEGFATGLSVEAATGIPVAAALNAGNLLPVAKQMRSKFSEIRLIVCGDDDHKTAGNPGLTKAREAARAVGGLLAVPTFDHNRSDGDSDFNDLHQRCGVEAVREAIDQASAPDSLSQACGSPSPPANASGVVLDMAEEIERLASLTPLEYDKVRLAQAKALGVRPSTLDVAVKRERKAATESSSPVNDLEPWPEAVVPAAVLDEVARTVHRFIACDREVATAAALWAAMTWVIDSIQVAPLAVITAPEKRCGKSQLLTVLGKLSRRPLMASNITPAALFRSIDAWQPTLLIDEADAFMKDNEELRGILNCGHTRDSAYVVRTVGDAYTPTKFNVWGAKAIAGIGKLADTLMDRAIVLQLRRKLPHETVDRLRLVDSGEFETIARKLARFGADYADSVVRARPELPATLNDRAKDNWEPLVAIAECAGGDWLDLSRKAALKLTNADGGDAGVGNELLADIQEVFDTKRVDRISTADLVDALCEDTEKPWVTWNRGKPIAPRQLAQRLGEYDICSKTIRMGLNTPKGFERSQFEDAFVRYLAPPAPNATPPQANMDAGLGVADSTGVAATHLPTATQKPSIHAGCGGVADKRPTTDGSIVEVEI